MTLATLLDHADRMLTVLGAASAMLTALAAALPKEWRITGWCARAGVDLTGVLRHVREELPPKGPAA